MRVLALKGTTAKSPELRSRVTKSDPVTPLSAARSTMDRPSGVSSARLQTRAASMSRVLLPWLAGKKLTAQRMP